MIFKSISQMETSIMKEQLVKDFLPDDACPLGSLLFMEAPGQIYKVDSNDSKSPDEVFTQNSSP